MEIGFKRNLTQLTSRYDEILVHLYVLLNRAGITEPFSATCDQSRTGQYEDDRDDCEFQLVAEEHGE